MESDYYVFERVGECCTRAIKPIKSSIDKKLSTKNNNIINKKAYFYFFLGVVIVIIVIFMSLFNERGKKVVFTATNILLYVNRIK